MRYRHLMYSSWYSRHGLCCEVVWLSSDKTPRRARAEAMIDDDVEGVVGIITIRHGNARVGHKSTHSTHSHNAAGCERGWGEGGRGGRRGGAEGKKTLLVARSAFYRRRSCSLVIGCRAVRAQSAP